MAIKKADKPFYAAEFIKQFDALERRNTSLIGWMMLKFSCSEREALKLIEAGNIYLGRTAQ